MRSVDIASFPLAMRRLSFQILPVPAALRVEGELSLHLQATCFTCQLNRGSSQREVRRFGGRFGGAGRGSGGRAGGSRRLCGLRCAV